MTAPNNPILFNAAASGFMAGALKGRWLMGGTTGSPPNVQPAYNPIVNTGVPPLIGTADPSYAALAAQALAVATAVDTDIAADTAGVPAGTQPISVGSTSIVPSTGAINMGEIGKDLCMKALMIAIIEGRGYPIPTTDLTSAEIAAEYTSIATFVEDAYLAFATVFVQPVSASSPAPLATAVAINNQLLLFAVYCGALGGILANNPGLASGTVGAEPLQSAYNAAIYLAIAVDALIAQDSNATPGLGNSITANASALGVALAPEADATPYGIYQNQLAKSKLMFSIALARMYSRNPAGLFATGSPENITAIKVWATAESKVIAAGYTALVADLQLGVITATLGLPYNPTLWNEAYCGFVSGNLSGRPSTTTSGTGASATTAATYNNQNFTALAAAAAVFAAEVDKTVGASDVTGAAVPTGGPTYITVEGAADVSTMGVQPTSGPLAEAQLGKTGLMWAICRGVNFGRPLVGAENPASATIDVTAATYAPIAQSIAAAYLTTAHAALISP